MRWSRQHDTAPSSIHELMNGPEPAVPADAVPDAVERPGTTPERRTAVAVVDTGAETGAEPLEDGPEATPDGFFDDEDYLPQERRSPGRLTVALVATLVLVVGAFGGIWLEKQLGAPTSTAAGFPAGASAPGGTGGFGGYGSNRTGGAAGSQAGTQAGGQAGGAPDGGTGAPAGGAAGSGDGAGTSTATPAVVGTVTAAGTSSLVVTDLGGAKHDVTITKATTVTTSYGHGSLKKGDTVAVTGQTRADGTVAASNLAVS